MARIAGVLISKDFGSSSMFQFSGILFMVCMVAAVFSVMAVVIFNCGHSSKKRKPRNNVAYYGSGFAPSYPTGAAGATTNNSSAAAKVAVGAAVGVVAGVAIADALDSSRNSGGGGCGGGGGGCGGGCGGGGGGCGGGCGG